MLYMKHKKGKVDGCSVFFWRTGTRPTYCSNEFM